MRVERGRERERRAAGGERGERRSLYYPFSSTDASHIFLVVLCCVVCVCVTWSWFIDAILTFAFCCLLQCVVVCRGA